jgi:lipoate-protein ligase A
MGLDEALLESAAAGGLPALRFYGWNPPAVSIGYFQKLLETVDVAACRVHGVDVVRRISGGGAVFHQAEITYSIILPVPEEAPSFERICGAVMEGLAILGISSRFKPVNDIYTGDKKISGSARISRGGRLLQHGTVLLDTDPGLMFTLLKIPGEKEALVRSAQERVTGASAVLGRAVSFGEAESALAEGFARRLSLDYKSEEFPAEDGRARTLAREHFAAPEFLGRR